MIPPTASFSFRNTRANARKSNTATTYFVPNDGDGLHGNSRWMHRLHPYVIWVELAAKGRFDFTFLGKFFSQTKIYLIHAAQRNSCHSGRLGGRHIERKTAQQRTKFGLGNLRKNENTGLLQPLQHLSPSGNGLFFLSHSANMPKNCQFKPVSVHGKRKFPMSNPPL